MSGEVTGFDEDNVEGNPTPTLVSDFDWDAVEAGVFSIARREQPLDPAKMIRAQAIRDCAEKLQAKNRMGIIIASLLFQWRAGVFPDIKSLTGLADEFGLNKQALYQANRRIYHDDWGVAVRSEDGRANIAKARHRRLPKTLPPNATEGEAMNQEEGSVSKSSPTEARKVNEAEAE